MLREFQATFDEWVETAKAEQKHTVTIYQEKLSIAPRLWDMGRFTVGRDRRTAS
jgi:hypothetical protein